MSFNQPLSSLSLSSLHPHHSRRRHPVLKLTSSPRSSRRVARPRIPHVSVIARSHGRSRRISDLVELCLGSLVTFQLSFQSKITKSGRDAKARERKGGGGDLLSRLDDEWTVSICEGFVMYLSTNSCFLRFFLMYMPYVLLR